MSEIPYASPGDDEDPPADTSLLRVVGGGPNHLVFAGKCPRCLRPMRYTVNTRVAVNHPGAALVIDPADNIAVEDAADIYYPPKATVVCNTGVKHPEAPDGVLGCGREYTYNFD